jgi:hypothetical protein
MQIAGQFVAVRTFIPSRQNMLGWRTVVEERRAETFNDPVQFQIKRLLLEQGVKFVMRFPVHARGSITIVLTTGRRDTCNQPPSRRGQKSKGSSLRPRLLVGGAR